MPRTTYIRAGLGAAVKAALLALAACAFEPTGGETALDGPDVDGAEVDAPEVDAPVIDAPMIDAPMIDAPMIDAPTIDAPMIDARVDAAIDAAIDAPTVTPLCSANDATLRLCLTFEGSVTDDSGGAAQLQTMNVGFGAGAVGMASTLGLTSVIHAAENSAFDVTTGLTVEAFVRVGTAPSQANNRAGVLDNNGQYGLWIDTQRRPYCTASGSTVNGPNALPLNTWVHLACVFDGARFILYVDGAVADQVNRTAELFTTGVDGLNVGQDCTAGGGAGDPLQGGIDELRLWSVGRSPAQIAAAAARMP